MNRDPDWSHIARYLGGDCSEAERRAFEARLATDSAWRETVEAARQVWESTAPEPDEWNVAGAWRELTRKQADAPPVRLVHSRSRGAAVWPLQQRRWQRTAVSMAAAAALLVSVGVALWLRGNRAHEVFADASASMYTVTTRPGQRLDLRMPDGTRVVLGVASTLRYANTYGVAQRQLYLDGQAYFDVVHDASKPFTVHARNAVARDIGTRFDVRAYADDHDVAVAVADGEVELAGAAPTATASSMSERITLTRGQVGLVDKTGTVAESTDPDLGQRLAWLDGRLVFKNVQLRDMLPELSRWYDVEFRLADPALGERRLDATFQGDSIAALLQFLAFSLDARSERNGRTVILVPNARAR